MLLYYSALAVELVLVLCGATVHLHDWARIVWFEITDMSSGM